MSKGWRKVPPPPITDTRWWDLKTGPLLQYLSEPRPFDDLVRWARSRGDGNLLRNMLAYLELRGRADGDSVAWKRVTS